MKEVEIGSKRMHTYVVGEEDMAAFQGEIVHPVCSTYVIGREMEWTGRLFVLDMCDPDEEGIGTMLNVNHLNPAFPGETLEFSGILTELDQNKLVCQIDVHTSGGRSIASGSTGQIILQKDKIKKLFHG